MNDIRQRYRRSQLGQFWITFAMATTIVTLGILYSYLFKMDLRVYLPYLGTSLVVWGLISGIVTDSGSAFINSEAYVKQASIPRSVFVHQMLVRNSIVFLHNLIILPPLYLFFGLTPSWVLLLAPIGVAFIILNGVWVGLLLGAFCARYRDMPQIIASLIQVVFFMTPVMWQPPQLPGRLVWLVRYNPVESFMDLVRDPLLGQAPPVSSWEGAAIVTVVGYSVSVLFFARFRARIIYWL
jgi:ABC-type polysaccharide/polyol phosphate export permease